MKEEGVTLIKPIDTQVLYPQTPEIAGRQQKSNQLPAEQQAQFGNIIKKEIQDKKDTIIPSNETEHLKTDKDGQYTKQGKKKKQNKEMKNSSSKSTIDIRI